MPKQKISFYVPTEILERLDKLAKMADIDRTKLIVNILDQCSNTLVATEKVGIYQFSVLLRNFGEQMKGWAEKVKKKKVDPL